jgi:hypothetical protein
VKSIRGPVDHFNDEGHRMPKLIATHEVDDVAHWTSSPKREEVFASVATDIRTFLDPNRPNHVGLSMDVPDMTAFQTVLESEEGAEAMRYDGVHPDTLEVYVQT